MKEVSLSGRTVHAKISRHVCALSFKNSWCTDQCSSDYKANKYESKQLIRAKSIAKVEHSCNPRLCRTLRALALIAQVQKQCHKTQGHVIIYARYSLPHRHVACHYLRFCGPTFSYQVNMTNMSMRNAEYIMLTHADAYVWTIRGNSYKLTITITQIIEYMIHWATGECASYFVTVALVRTVA